MTDRIIRTALNRPALIRRATTADIDAIIVFAENSQCGRSTGLSALHTPERGRGQPIPDGLRLADQVRHETARLE
jgi:hypothetical protein